MTYPDPRYLGHTPAQYLSVLVTIAGVVLWRYTQRTSAAAKA